MRYDQSIRHVLNELNKDSFALAFEKLFGESGDAGYRELRRILINYFRGQDLNGDADDLTDFTIDRVLRKANDNEVVIENEKDAIRYALGVAHYIRLEYLRQAAREERVDDYEFVSFDDQEEVEESEEQERLFDSMKGCLDELNERERGLLFAYYVSRRGETKRMAMEMKISHGSLRVRVYRIKQRLQAIYKRRLKESKVAHNEESVEC